MGGCSHDEGIQLCTAGPGLLIACVEVRQRVLKNSAWIQGDSFDRFRRLENWRRTVQLFSGT